jgi:hypothetical protein
LVECVERLARRTVSRDEVAEESLYRLAIERVTLADATHAQNITGCEIEIRGGFDGII